MAWTADERDAAYTGLCEAITAAGPGNEAAFLARLCLLLMEECADPARVGRAIQEAAVTAPPGPIQTA